MSVTLGRGLKVSDELSDVFLFADTRPDPWDDPRGGVEAESVSHFLSAAGLQSQEHVSSLYGGECEMRREMKIISWRHSYFLWLEKS